MVSCCLLCLFQRVEELEKENAVLKSEKEEMNQIILQQSETSAGKSQTCWSMYHFSLAWTQFSIFGLKWLLDY